MAIPFFDGGDTDWGNTGTGGDGGATSTPDPVPPDIIDLVTDESGTLAVAYGKHVFKGTLILNKRTTGPPATSVVFAALGEGVWDSCVALYYAGEAIDGANFHFHPGTLSPGTGDGTQGVDSFHSSGLTYSRTAYVAVSLPEKYAAEDRPDKLIGIYQCLKVPNYDFAGNRTDNGSYSANPARCAAHAIIDRSLFPASRVNWSSWVDFRDFCDVTLSWDNDGDNTSNLSIPRFQCHVVFAQETNLATALDIICGTAGVVWQDEGNVISFKLPTDQTSIHDFNESNIVQNTFNFYARDLKERPNRMQGRFRDIRDTYLAEATEEANPRESLQDAVGLVDPGIRALGNMEISQAQRLLERMMRIESDNPIIAELRGMSDSFHVLPGDYVTVTHTAANWNLVKCIVLEAAYQSAERAAEETNFILQRIDGILYADSDMRPVQAPVTP